MDVFVDNVFVDVFVDVFMHVFMLSCIFPGNRVFRFWWKVTRFSKNTGIPCIFPFFVPGSLVPRFRVYERLPGIPQEPLA